MVRKGGERTHERGGGAGGRDREASMSQTCKGRGGWCHENWLKKVALPAKRLLRPASGVFVPAQSHRQVGAAPCGGARSGASGAAERISNACLARILSFATTGAAGRLQKGRNGHRGSPVAGGRYRIQQGSTVGILLRLFNEAGSLSSEGRVLFEYAA